MTPGANGQLAASALTSDTLSPERTGTKSVRSDNSGYGMRMPEIERAITSRWISEVASKFV